MVASKAHSKSVQGCPALVKLKGSVRGIWPVSRMNSAVRRCRPTPGSSKMRLGLWNIHNSMAKKRKKPKVGNHQIGFIADSNIEGDVRPCHAWLSRALKIQ